MIENRIKGKRAKPKLHVPPSKTQYEEVQAEKSSLSRLLGNLRSGKPANAPETKPAGPDLKQRAVREGIKLRNIMHTVGMTELGHTDFSFN